MSVSRPRAAGCDSGSTTSIIAAGSWPCRAARSSNLDAMDITAPYTPGALRGGSHVHVFSPNGERVSFNYNDHVMHELDPALDLRNVGVAAPLARSTYKSSIRVNTAVATGACW